LIAGLAFIRALQFASAQTTHFVLRDAKQEPLPITIAVFSFTSSTTQFGGSHLFGDSIGRTTTDTTNMNIKEQSRAKWGGEVTWLPTAMDRIIDIPQVFS